MASDLARELQEAGRELDAEVEGHALRFTSLDKKLLPAISKRELLRYLLSVAPTMLEYLRDRPISMVRYPEGAGGPRIFQRHWSKGLPEFVDTVSIYSESNHEPMEFTMVNNLPTLLWLGQMSVLEIHPWHSRTVRGADAKGKDASFDDPSAFEQSVLNYPDYMVCDLDPNFSNGFERVVSVAKAARDLFDGEALESFVKTSGKRGLHVYVPLERRYRFDEVRSRAEAIGARLQKEQGDVTIELSLDRRPAKVFFDYSINSQSKTLACAYSPRGVDWAGVSFPLAWKDLEGTSPEDFTVGTVPELLERRGDAWGKLFASFL